MVVVTDKMRDLLLILMMAVLGRAEASDIYEGDPAHAVNAKVYALSGKLVGLPRDTELVLQHNEAHNLVVRGGTNVPFRFPDRVLPGARFHVQVIETPPGISCTVANGKGVISNADVTNITVTCRPATIASGAEKEREQTKSSQKKRKASTKQGEAATPVEATVETIAQQPSVSPEPLVAATATPVEPPAPVAAPEEKKSEEKKPEKPQAADAADKDKQRRVEKQFQPLYQRQLFERMR
jgi:hypothetical protein